MDRRSGLGGCSSLAFIVALLQTGLFQTRPCESRVSGIASPRRNCFLVARLLLGSIDTLLISFLCLVLRLSCLALGLFLALLEQARNVCKPVTGNYKAATDQGFATSHDAVTTASLVLVAIGIDIVVFLADSNLDGPVDIIYCCLLDLAGLRLNDRDSLIKLGKKGVA